MNADRRLAYAHARYEMREAMMHATHAFYVIAADVTTAKAIACKIATGSLPDLYPTETDALAAWREYPAPLHSRYHPFAVSLYTGAVGDLTKRLS